MQRVTKVFKEATKGAKPGDDITRKIKRAKGHRETGIGFSTLLRWRAQGLVEFDLSTTKNRSGANTKRAIGPVKLTAEGFELRASREK